MSTAQVLPPNRPLQSSESAFRSRTPSGLSQSYSDRPSGSSSSSASTSSSPSSASSPVPSLSSVFQSANANNWLPLPVDPRVSALVGLSVGVLCALFMQPLHWWLLPDQVPLIFITVSRRILTWSFGFGLLLAGFWFNAGAKDALRRAGTTEAYRVRPTELITTGPYGVTRNPLFASHVMIYLAFACFTNSAWFLATLCAHVAYLQMKVIPAEEQALGEAFSDNYQEYCSIVPRWFVRSSSLNIK